MSRTRTVALAAGVLLSGVSHTAASPDVITSRMGAGGFGPPAPISKSDLEALRIPVGAGHHTEAAIRAMAGFGPRGGAPPFDPDAAPPGPLVQGEVVNFEAPIHKALALDSAAERLYAVNPPNASVTIIDLSGTRMKPVGEIPVGLEPSALAVEPGTRRLWVANYVSDNVMVIDPTTRGVLAVIEVGDRPNRILFNASGSHAFIVCEGSPAVLDAKPGAPTDLAQEGALVSIDTGALQIVESTWLDCFTPRAAVYDASTETVIVAAHDSGNNTTVAGFPVVFEMDNLELDDGFEEPDIIEFYPGLVVPLFMTSTQVAWSSPKLSPWPDVTFSGLGGQELVQRIVTDAGHPSTGDHPWQQIVDVLSLPNGDPDPAMVSELESVWETLYEQVTGTPVNLRNATDVLAAVINDAKDTTDHDLVIVDVSTPGTVGSMQVTSILGNIGARLAGMALSPDGSTLLISNHQPNNTVRLENVLRGNILEHEMVEVTGFHSASPVAMHENLHASVANFDDVSAPNPEAQAMSLANPLDVVFSGDGQKAYVAASGVGRIGVLASNGTVLGRVDLPGEHSSPRSLALDVDGQRLYAWDRVNQMVTRLDISSDALMVVDSICLSSPEYAFQREGRQFLYSNQFTNNFGHSCASCHPSGHMDKLAWDLGDQTKTGFLEKPHTSLSAFDLCNQNEFVENHPIKGPMFTQSLRGLANRAPFHWRGDRPDFQAFNPAFTGLLGAEEELSDEEMNTFTAFIDTMEYMPTWYRARNNTFKDSGALIGRVNYLAQCQVCHALEADGALDDACADGDIAFAYGGMPFYGQIQLVPQFRGINDKFQADLYTGFGLLHDAREERESADHPLQEFLNTIFPGIAAQGDEMIAFMNAFQTNVMPVVGQQFIWDDESDPSQQAKLTEMIAQHDLLPTRCDVIVRWSAAGAARGMTMTQGGATPLFRTDVDEMLTLGQVEDMIRAGVSFVVTAVPPGSGLRLGIDWDRDCVVNRLDSRPLYKEGDVNDDTLVNFDDLNTVLSNWNKLEARQHDGDLDGDCRVTFDDLNIVLGAWGTQCGGAGQALVQPVTP